MGYKQLPNPDKWIIKGIPVLFVIGSLMHFAYESFGNSPLIGAIAPVNESIWEHLKLALVPMILWYGVYYAVNAKLCKINKHSWFSANLVSLLVYLIFVPAFYYTYTGALGIKSLFMDILDYFLAVMAGQFTALRFYKSGRQISYCISLVLIGLLVLVFILFTFYPLHIPMFMDMNTLKYGI